MVMRVKSASRFAGRRVPLTWVGWMVFMLFFAPALVDAVADRLEEIVQAVHGLRMTEHQITILLECAGHTLKQLLLRGLVEINKHVAAKNNVKLLLHGPGIFLQVEPVKMNQRFEKRFGYHLTLMRTLPFQKITA